MDSKNLREATHAGSWYSNHPQVLGAELSGYFSKAEKFDTQDRLKSIIVPHAGYCYSAPTAAKAFINIDPDKYNRVVVLGPSHHEYFRGCGLTPFDSFQTPFGNIKVDTATNAKLLNDSCKSFFTLPEAIDEEEHSIELEIPFLKLLYNKKDFSLLPIMVGDTSLANNRKIGEALFDLYKDPNTLFVISSDFCHWGRRFGYTYYDEQYDEIWKSTEHLDKMALDIIASLDAKKLDDYFKKYKNTICGQNPISIVLCMIEKYKQMYEDKNIHFDCAGYTQSEKVKNRNGSSVSYAAAVNYIG